MCANFSTRFSSSLHPRQAHTSSIENKCDFEYARILHSSLSTPHISIVAKISEKVLYLQEHNRQQCTEEMIIFVKSRFFRRLLTLANHRIIISFLVNYIRKMERYLSASCRKCVCGMRKSDGEIIPRARVKYDAPFRF